MIFGGWWAATIVVYANTVILAEGVKVLLYLGAAIIFGIMYMLSIVAGRFLDMFALSLQRKRSRTGQK